MAPPSPQMKKLKISNNLKEQLTAELKKIIVKAVAASVALEKLLVKKEQLSVAIKMIPTANTPPIVPVLAVLAQGTAAVATNGNVGHHREVICTVWFSNCEPIDEDDDGRKLPMRREVPCPSPPVDLIARTNPVCDEPSGSTPQSPPTTTPTVSTTMMIAIVLNPYARKTVATAPKKRSALASVANPYDRKKKSQPLSGKENLGLGSKNTNDVKSSIAEMEIMPRAVCLSPGDKRFELHYPQAHGPIKSHADLFFKITVSKHTQLLVLQRRCWRDSLKINTPKCSADIMHLHIRRESLMVMSARTAVHLIIRHIWLNAHL